MNILIFSLLLLINTLLACAPKTETKSVEVPTKVEAESLPVQDITVLTSFDQLKRIYTSSPDTIYVVNLWATWCKPCVAELPYFNMAADQLKDKKVKFIFASMDFIDAIDKSVKPFLRKKPLSGSVYIMGDQDVNTWGYEIDSKWDGAIPVTIVVANGKKSSRLGSFENEQDLMNFINQYL